MDLYLRIKSPGSYLSLETLFRSTNSIEEKVREAILDTLHELAIQDGRNIGRDQIGRAVKYALGSVHGRFRLLDVRRGSWELALTMAVGGVLAKAAYDLGIDLVKKHPRWSKFVDWFASQTWTACAKNAATRIEGIQHLGALKVTTLKIEIVQGAFGPTDLNVDIATERTGNEVLPENSIEQIRLVLKQIESAKKKKNGTKATKGAKRRKRRK